MLHRSKGRGRPAAMTPRPTRSLHRNETMNAQTAKDQFTYTLGNSSYVDYLYDEPPVTVVKTPQPSIRQWLSRAVSAVVEWRRRQAVLQEMQMLTDRELADIGLTRADLPRVFDPAFAVSHARGRDYIGY
jgi:uncharacterized protein YjiS (DUF1127 family)